MVVDLESGQLTSLSNQPNITFVCQKLLPLLDASVETKSCTIFVVHFPASWLWGVLCRLWGALCRLWISISHSGCILYVSAPHSGFNIATSKHRFCGNTMCQLDVHKLFVACIYWTRSFKCVSGFFFSFHIISQSVYLSLSTAQTLDSIVSLSFCRIHRSSHFLFGRHR